jgi:hypothetical protein
MTKRVLGAMLLTWGLVAGGCAVGTDGIEGASETLSPNSPDCALVRCALPLCAEGQHLSYRGGCCPQCVGRPSRCEAVLCPLVLCADGYEYTTSPGDCCGRCTPSHAAQECRSDADCPQYYCIACPCPVSECRGHQCVTSTPDASTCGVATF